MWHWSDTGNQCSILQSDRSADAAVNWLPIEYLFTSKIYPTKEVWRLLSHLAWRVTSLAPAAGCGGKDPCHENGEGSFVKGEGVECQAPSQTTNRLPKQYFVMSCDLLRADRQSVRGLIARKLFTHFHPKRRCLLHTLRTRRSVTI